MDKRKRDANFTAHEKLLLAKLIKQHPVLESRASDTMALVERKRAWQLLTDAYNCNAFVVKRDTKTLKRAWDNIKTRHRKLKAAESENEQTIPPPKTEEIINMVAQTAPAMCKVILNIGDEDKTENSTADYENIKTENIKIEKSNVSDNFQVPFEESTYSNNHIQDGSDSEKNWEEQDHQAPKRAKKNEFDYIKQEAVLRTKHFKEKTKLEMQILQVRLRAEEARKRAAELEERRNRIYLEIAKSQLCDMNRIDSE